MIKYLIVILAISTYIQANNTTKNLITEYEDKAYYHQFITKEYKIALGYHVMACELGSGVACSNAGSLYFPDNIEDRENTKKAITYYQKACDLHNGYACNMMANLYEEGIIFKQDYLKAWEYSIKGCKYHDIDACKAVNYLKK